MDITTLKLIQRVLLREGWYYYPANDTWSTGNTFDDMIISNTFLVFYLRDVPSICHFFTFVVRKPELYSPILSVLPDKYFTKFEVFS